ncbi:MAG: hypothetical protein B7C24_05590 [Bacteroidetes bacterium 4572_77]|nr:MAG: hypothetical protein B7C24_05590 [Bacteroidetes bacterium 4572_77]
MNIIFESMLKKSLLILLFISSFSFVWAQTAQLDCLSVSGQNGAVKVEYSGPNTATSFNIYRADQIDGDYSLIFSSSTTPFGVYVDTEINAASQSYSYYTEALVGGQSTGISNKLRTLLLDTHNPENGLAELNWIDPGINPSDAYAIWRKSPNQNYMKIGETQETFYTDTIKACDTIFYYQIRVNTPICTSISNLRGELFNDNQKPNYIIPENASIDVETGEIILSWLLPPPEDADIVVYQIRMIDADGGSTFPLAEIDGYENTSVRLPSTEVCDTTATFIINAIDSCGNSSTWENPDYYIRTLNMYDPVYNICNDECVLIWDSIYPWHNIPLAGVKIYRSEDEGPFEEIANVTDPSIQQVSVFGFERGLSYEFYIQSYSENEERSSTSCIKGIVGKKPKNTEFTLLRAASIQNGEVQLKWQIDGEALVPEYAIARSNNDIDYQMIDTILGNHQSFQMYIDKKSEYYREPQYYRVIPFDSCYNPGDSSNLAKTILLDVDTYEDGKALLNWTAYEYMEDLSHYNIYRIIDSLVYPYPITEIMPNAELSYIDDYGGVAPTSSRVGYLVEAVGRVVDTLPEYDKIRSNVNFLTKASNLYVPSGFNPKGGITKEFIPVFTGIRVKNYNFKILNRWGQILFETHQPILGWNGKYKGNYVMPGAYVYVVHYETIYQKSLTKSGVFYVM